MLPDMSRSAATSDNGSGAGKSDRWHKPPRKTMSTSNDLDVALAPAPAEAVEPIALPVPEAAAFNDGPLRPKTARLTKVSIVIPVYNEEATIQFLVGLVAK